MVGLDDLKGVFQPKRFYHSEMTSHLKHAQAIDLQILICRVEECFYGQSFSGVSQSLKATTK